MRQQIFLWDHDILHNDLPRDRSTEGKLPLDLRSRQSLHSLETRIQYTGKHINRLYSRHHTAQHLSTSRDWRYNCAHLLQYEASDLAIFTLAPNNEHICYGGVGDPVKSTQDDQRPTYSMFPNINTKLCKSTQRGYYVHIYSRLVPNRKKEML